MSNERQEVRREILTALLPNVPFDGWSETALRRAAVATGREAAAARRAFPGGPIEAVDVFIAEADARMEQELAGRDLASLKIRERIATAVRVRLETHARHREAVRRALSLQLLPGNAPRALRGLYRTVDRIWWLCGDNATDFNHYTKRALLAGVYATTLVHWLNDESDGAEDTWAFLDRRIADVMQIQKARGRFDKLMARLPNPVGLLATLRHGLKRRGRRTEATTA